MRASELPARLSNLTRYRVYLTMNVCTYCTSKDFEAFRAYNSIHVRHAISEDTNCAISALQ